MKLAVKRIKVRPVPGGLEYSSYGLTGRGTRARLETVVVLTDGRSPADVKLAKQGVIERLMGAPQ